MWTRTCRSLRRAPWTPRSSHSRCSRRAHMRGCGVDGLPALKRGWLAAGRAARRICCACLLPPLRRPATQPVLTRTLSQPPLPRAGAAPRGGAVRRGRGRRGGRRAQVLCLAQLGADRGAAGPGDRAGGCLAVLCLRCACAVLAWACCSCDVLARVCPPPPSPARPAGPSCVRHTSQPLLPCLALPILC